MSDVFEKALSYTLQYEGGWSDDPDDRGGATNFGLTIGFAQETNDLEIFDVDGDGDIDKIDIKNLTHERAHDAYKEYVWDKHDLDSYSPKIAFNLFDMVVNHGPKNSFKMLQMAICKCGFQIDVDGAVGNETIGALNQCDQNELVKNLLNIRRDFFRKITVKRPQNQKFLKGWLNRCNAIESIIDTF